MMLFQVPSRLIAVRPPTFAIKGAGEGGTGEGLAWPKDGTVVITHSRTDDRNNPPTIVLFIWFSSEAAARRCGLYPTVRPQQRSDFAEAGPRRCRSGALSW